MTAWDAPGKRPAYPPMDRVKAYGRACTRPPLGVQVAQLSADLAALSALTARNSPRARGAALAVAHGALKLAVTPVADADDRDRRSAVLRESVLPALLGVGLGHTLGLVDAVLAHDGDPARLGRGVETRQ